MTEDAFERDLRTVLRDLAPTAAPAALRDRVAAVPLGHAVPRRAARPANRRRFLAFAGIAAVVAVAAVSLALALSGGFNGLVAGPSPVVVPSTATPSRLPGLGWSRLTFAVAARSAATSPGASPTPDDARAALEVATSRLRAEGIAYSAALRPDGLAVTVPEASASSAEQLIGTTGQFAFVPLGLQPVETGAVIDLAAHPPLFGGTAITSAVLAADQTGQRAVDLTLSSSAREAFAAYSAAHIGESFAIVLDGKVLSAPVIQSAIPNGQLQLQAPGGWDLAAASQLITFLQFGAMPWPLAEVSAEPTTGPVDLWTPAPATPAPTAAPTPSEVTPPSVSFPPSGNAVTDGCLNGSGPTLPEGYLPGAPVLEQDDGTDGAAMIVVPQPPYPGAPDMIWVYGCRYQRLPDGTVAVVNGSGGGMLAQLTTPAFIDEAGLGNPPSADQVIIGQARSEAKRIVAEFANGSTIEAERSGDYWMVWSRTSSPLKRVVAYDASGAAIWSGTWPYP